MPHPPTVIIGQGNGETAGVGTRLLANNKLTAWINFDAE